MASLLSVIEDATPLLSQIGSHKGPLTLSWGTRGPPPANEWQLLVEETEPPHQRAMYIKLLSHG